VREPGGEPFTFTSAWVINSAGLFADKIARMVGIDTACCGYDLSYCRGQYFRIQNPSKFSLSHLVYPPATNVSLGIHVTPDLGEGLRLGPDAKYISSIEYTLDENEQVHFYESVRTFLPNLELTDLMPDTVGVRPKLQKENEGFHDFVLNEESEKGFPQFINLIGIESPGLTGCLSLARQVKKFLKRS
jgi:L-2-hydroxyglutarate oxidase LhgO